MAFESESDQIVKSVVEQVSKIVSEMAGIQLGDRQAFMVESRLKTRMIRLGIQSFADYLSYLKKFRESEIRVADLQNSGHCRGAGLRRPARRQQTDPGRCVRCAR